MEQKWEISEVSTPERIFDKINDEMAQPVGIVLFGADCDLKDGVFKEFIERVSNLAFCYTDVTSASIMCRFNAGVNVMVTLNSEMSSHHEQRHRVVTTLRDFGAKTVVGVYARMVEPKRDSYYMMSETRAKREEVRRCIAELKSNPPTADGLDYLLIVSEEKEG